MQHKKQVFSPFLSYRRSILQRLSINKLQTAQPKRDYFLRRMSFLKSETLRTP